MKHLWLVIFLAVAGLMALAPNAAFAQQQVYECIAGISTTNGALSCTNVSSINPLPVTSSASSPTTTVIEGSPSASIGITPVVSASAENNHVFKAGAGNLYSAYAINLTSTPGYLVLINATTAPADGAITPLACAFLPAGGSVSINNKPGPPQVYSTGITAVLTSANTCFTKTTGVITGYISGDIQ